MFQEKQYIQVFCHLLLPQFSSHHRWKFHQAHHFPLQQVHVSFQEAAMFQHKVCEQVHGKVLQAGISVFCLDEEEDPVH